jgi:hypothetical protein
LRFACCVSYPRPRNVATIDLTVLKLSATGSAFSPPADDLAQPFRSLLYLRFPSDVDRFALGSRDLVPVEHRSDRDARSTASGSVNHRAVHRTRCSRRAVRAWCALRRVRKTRSSPVRLRCVCAAYPVGRLRDCRMSCLEARFCAEGVAFHKGHGCLLVPCSGLFWGWEKEPYKAVGPCSNRSWCLSRRSCGKATYPGR